MADLFSVDAGSETIRVLGKITRIRFEQEETGFYIFTLTPGDGGKALSVKGTGVHLAEGKDVQVTGVMEPSKNPKYPDPVLRAESITEVLPKTLEGIRKYLSGGFVANVGPVLAEALVDHFGVDVFEVIENTPERLSEVPNIGEKRIEALVNAFKESVALKTILPFLLENGLGARMAVRVYKALGANAAEKIKANPYLLQTVPLIGFRKADDFAVSIGYAEDSDFRIRAAIEEVIAKEGEAGNTAVALPRLYESTKKLLDKLKPGGKRTYNIPEVKIRRIVEAELDSGAHITRRIICGGVEAVSLTPVAQAEEEIAERLLSLMEAGPDKRLGHFDAKHPSLAHLDDDQKNAVRLVLGSRVSVITGLPGCGKTTVTKAIVDMAREAGVSFVLCAQMGRAAKRITEATGHPASTIHRTLGANGAGFAFNAGRPLPYDLVIVDEGSVLDTTLTKHLLRALAPGTTLIVVGDANQLPSIGAGNILSDIIGSEIVPVGQLRHIHRQALGSSIIVNAHRIINGEVPVGDVGKDDFAIVSCHDPAMQSAAVVAEFRRRLAQGFSADDIQVLTPRRRNSPLGANELNVVLKETINPASLRPSVRRGGELETTFSVGDRVMQTANNRDLGVYNGEIGYTTDIEVDEKTRAVRVAVSFCDTDVELGMDDLYDLDLAYASTIHKAQGSEFPVVIIPISKGHWQMLDRNLLFTAVTRGKQRLSLVGDDHMLKAIVARAGSAVRLTGLRDCIAVAYERRVSIEPRARKPLGALGAGQAAAPASPV